MAANDPDGWPDLKTLRTFNVPGGTGITYRAGTWHHPMIALDAPASFAARMRMRNSSIWPDPLS